MQNRHSSFVLLIVFTLFSQLCLRSQTDDSVTTAHEKGRSAAIRFLQSYRSILVTTMNKEGTSQSIAVCADTAQRIAQEMSRGSGLKMKRVSVRWRNKNNAPDAYEDSVLQVFQEMRGRGELKESTEHFSVVASDSGPVARYLKPITVQSVCLNCHGTEQNLSEEIRRTLNDRYPDDRAVGYAVGDVRGAVSIVIPLRFVK